VDAEIELSGERVALLPEGALWWPRARTLLVADPHWGKAAAFRASGVPVPRGTTLDGLGRLDACLARTGAERLVVLGDFLHAPEGRAPDTLGELEGWRTRHAALDLLLVRGNHDLRAGDPPPELGVRCVDAPLVERPFVLTHHPKSSAEGYVLAGHLHPGVRLVGRGRQRERLPCFWFGQTVGVLPAFGAFTGLATIISDPGDRVFVVADGSVLEVN
jgi:DNA ligase-associated metallophosphoesterase